MGIRPPNMVSWQAFSGRAPRQRGGAARVPRAVFVVLAIAALLPSAARAQSVDSAGPTYTLGGTIVTADGAPVGGAEIEVVQSGEISRRARSDTAGRFLVSHLSDRSVVVRVRCIGYKPRSIPLTILATERRKMFVLMLDAAVDELPATTVLANADDDVRLQEFYSRQATNQFGRYIGPAAIERREPAFISDMLRQVPGVELRRGSIGNRVTIRGCSPLVWVDGARIVGAEVDDVAPAANVAAVEVYTSYAGVPSEYFDRSATCGTILVWTKIR